MSDDPILAALARLEAGQTEMSSRLARVQSEQTRLRGELNNKLDDILDKMAAIRMDTDTARGNVLYALQDSLTLGQRITKLEEEVRKGRPPP
jgi:hypothetical protein